MNNSNHFDFCVLGAGLAGLAVSKSLIESGATVCLIDVGDIASGASGTPLGLVNPATGRYGKKSWRAEDCYTEIYEDLKEVQSGTDIRLFDKTGVLRPAQDDKMATRMHENVQKSKWSEGWCSWLDKIEVNELNPEIHCVEGAMWLPHGLTVVVEAYLKAKAQRLSEEGLKIFTNLDYSISEKREEYEIRLTDSENLQAKNIICASGSETKNSPYWEYLPIHPIKGQVAVFESPKTKDFKFR